MVDGINISSPLLSGAGEVRGDVSKAVVVSGDKKITQSPKQVSPVSNNETESVSSAIAKSAERRLDALSAGNVRDFLQAAEKFIDASLPNKPPGTRLRINLDDGSGRFVYQGVDVNTGDVVTQFPADEVLKFLSFIREQKGVEGIVVDEEV